MPALLIKIEAALGADLTALPSSWTWTDITAYWLRSGDINIQRGGQSEFDTLHPSRITFALNNSDGRFTSTNPVGAYYGTWGLGTPVRVSINAGSGYVVRGTGFVSQMRHEWPVIKESFAAVVVTADGIGRRLSQGRKTIQSPLMRLIAASSPVAHWPLNDGPNAIRAASAVTGVPDMLVLPLTTPSIGGGSTASSPSEVVQFAAIPGPPGHPGPVIDLPSPRGGNWFAVLAATPTPSATGTWVMDMWLFADPGNADASGSASSRFQWFTSGTGRTRFYWFTDLVASVPTLTLTAATADDLTFTNYAFTSPNIFDRSWHYARVVAATSGADIALSIYIDGVLVSSPTIVTSSPGGIRTVWINGYGLSGARPLRHLSATSIAIYSSQTVSASSVYDVGRGHSGETSTARFARLTAEEVVASSVTGSTTTAMGPQPSGELLADLVREIQDTEVGLASEGTDGSLILRTRSSLYNEAVALTLDYDASQLAVPWVPNEDDLQVRNDWTVSQPGGASARYLAPAVDPTSATYDPSTAVRPDEATINLYSDSELPYHAQWRVHLGQDATLRYPQVSMNLDRSTSLQAAWLAMDIGSRIQITNPPQQLAPDTIDLLMAGYTETFHRHGFGWRVDANCIGFRPYEVFKVEDTRLGRLDSANSSLLAAATSGATTLRIWTDTTLGPLWTTTTGYDLEIAGERITPTAVSSSAISFVNAGTATHANNASVVPGMPASIQAGDALFVLAAIRNSGTGTVNTPAGYTHLFEADSMALFGKIYDGSESAPTISFTNGVANATTSAQMAAFRNCSLEVCNFATQSNASAQNIAYPAMGSDRWNSLFLVLGWKQDDWTSVAALGGMNEIGEPSSTTGDDQGLVWDYLIQGATGNQEIAAGSFTVTGGASAISRGAVVSIAGDVQTFTVTRSVNSVAKTQAAGTPVHTWRTGFTAL